MATCRSSLWMNVLLLLTVVTSRYVARTLRQKRSLALKHVKTWSNGVVPYVFKTTSANSNGSEDAFSKVDRLLIRKAMDTIEQETCVKFEQIKEGTSKERSPYVEISGRNDKHCYATLGMITEGKNEIILNSLCRTSFTMSSNPVWEPRKHLKSTPLFPLREKDLSFEDAVAINRLYNCAANCTQRKRKCNGNAFLTARCRCETAEWCVDLEPNQCPRLIKEGYCYFDAWTKIHCQQSCGLCPPQDVAKRQTYSLDAREYLLAYQTGECYNRFDDLKCMIFAESGHCEKNPSFMTSYCALSCGNCHKQNTSDLSYLRILQTGCRNLIDDERCNALASEHKCRGITLKQCMLSCGVCRDESLKPTTLGGPATTPAVKVRLVCKDKSTMCPWLVEHGHCLTKPEQMEQLCPLSCKFCLEDCVDLDPPHICVDVKKRGYCIYDARHASRCAKSCGLCKTQQPDKSSSKQGEDIGDNEGTQSGVIEKVGEPCTETDPSNYLPAKVKESTIKKKMHRK
ncbi:hypothetical protein CRM22_000094 [Opisthorchis felineus]|uniref:ShKT domain-containing protein n=1 Tax=Opisthorchis felineus TaxID=147828 RepID=A0A4S2MGK8_OPIFE|nr:hypothetical protein CRM22_000094 [Opisthorchis felineus]